jgi:hypothetical protein
VVLERRMSAGPSWIAPVWSGSDLLRWLADRGTYITRLGLDGVWRRVCVSTLGTPLDGAGEWHEGGIAWLEPMGIYHSKKPSQTARFCSSQ